MASLTLHCAYARLHWVNANTVVGEIGWMGRFMHSGVLWATRSISADTVDRSFHSIVFILELGGMSNLSAVSLNLNS
ncbi:MAG TPA: hypothetical protein V6D11_30665 [Waterburya sp.]